MTTMWKEFERIIKDNGCIALWSQSPFDKTLSRDEQMRFVAQSKITKDTLSSIFSVMIYWTIRRKTQYSVHQ